MWTTLTIQTTQIREKIIRKSKRDAAGEQEGHMTDNMRIRRFSKSTKERGKNIAIPYYKKPYYRVPQTEIIECLKMFKIYDKVVNFIMRAMKNWKVYLKPENKIQKGIFQVDSPFSAATCYNYDAI